MGTAFSDIITANAMVQIDDERLKEELAENPALFFRTMCGYFLDAIPLFNRPPEARRWLAYTAPVFGDYRYTSTAAQTAPVTVATGLTGFDLCSAGIIGTDAYGNPTYTKTTVTYDAITGDAVLDIDLTVGEVIDFDLYTDGSFTYTLNPQMCRILGLATQYEWECRFANAYLIQVPKIKDKSFSTEAEGGTSRAATERLKMLKGQLNAEMLNFEQAICYLNLIPPTQQIPTFD